MSYISYSTQCSRCKETGGRAHSFEHIGQLRDGKTHIFYTSLANAVDPEDSPDTLLGYLYHMNETRPHPWIWLLDCRGMKTKDLVHGSMAKQLSEVVQHVNIETLSSVFILHPTWAMNALVQFIKPFLYKETRQRIHICNLGLIDTINRLENAGIQRSELSILTKKCLT